MNIMAMMLLFAASLAQLEGPQSRQEKFDRLAADFESAVTAYYDSELPKEATDTEKIRHYQSWPGWYYMPQFVALAQGMPDDDVAFACCEWIIDRCSNVGNNELAIYESERIAWEILSEHHSHREEIPLLCLRAVQYSSPAREKFLRDLLDDYRQPVKVHGFAYLALAELLARKYEFTVDGGIVNWPDPKNDFEHHLRLAIAPEWTEYMHVTDPEKFRLASGELFRHVSAHYGDIEFSESAPFFRHVKTLGEKAEKSLHALEDLRVGKEAPEIAGTDLHGKLLRLADYRGKVVLLSFWSTGCGPCMEMVPEEKHLAATYSSERFAVIGINEDREIAEAQKTAKEKEMNWPCFYDGEGGPIHAAYNVNMWPTFYLIDPEGKIAAKDVTPSSLIAEVEKLMERYENQRPYLSGN